MERKSFLLRLTHTALVKEIDRERSALCHQAAGSHAACGLESATLSLVDEQMQRHR